MPRIKGTKSTTIIRDEAISPFYLSKDRYCYTIMEDVVSEKKGRNDEGYEAKHGHYQSLPMALKKIAILRVDDQKKEYDSIKEYIDSYEKIKNETENLLNQLKLK
jgi:hypothetical protein